MISLINWFITSVKRERGATAIEYALLVALIAVAIIVILGLLGVELNRVFKAVVDALTAVPTPTPP